MHVQTYNETLNDSGNIEDNVIVDFPWTFYGTVVGTICVVKGGSLDFHGVCCRDLIVYEGGQAKVHGLILGDVDNAGGDLKIFGTISGNLSADQGDTYVSEGAVIQYYQEMA